MRVRLIHALGQQEFELSPRSVEEPIVVGRSSQVDLQIPSIDVSPVHAVLFVHEGAWIVQDCYSGSRTLVNGQPIDAPTVLKTGDVITFGEGPKTARLSVISLDSSAIPAFPPITVEPEIEAWNPSATITPLSPRPKKRKRSRQVVLIPVIGSILIGIGCVSIFWAYLAYTRKVTTREEQLRKNQAAPAIVVVPQPSQNQRKTIFMSGPDTQTSSRDPSPAPDQTIEVNSIPSSPIPPEPQPPAPVHNPVTPVTKTIPEPADSRPHSPDTKWEELLEARDALPPAQALYQFLRYRSLYAPDESKLQKLDAFQNDAMDLLWWQRINDLITQQNQIITQIEELKCEKASLPRNTTPERREQFDKQIQHLQSVHNNNLLLLRNEMKFEGNQPVDLSDETELNELRNRRDAEAYQRWTQRVISRVQATRGSSAW